MSSQQSENGIPVLTEIIGTAASAVDLPERRIAPQPPAVMPAALLPEPASGTVPGRLDGATVERIERAVAARVLQQLMAGLDSVLEQRIRESLADVLQTAVDGLACQLRFGLKETLEDALTRAINQEMKKLQDSK